MNYLNQWIFCIHACKFVDLCPLNRGWESGHSTFDRDGEQKPKVKRLSVGTHKVFVHVVHAGPHVEHHVVQHAEGVPHVRVLEREPIYYTQKSSTHWQPRLRAIKAYIGKLWWTASFNSSMRVKSSCKNKWAIIKSHGRMKDTYVTYVKQQK